MSGRYKQGGQGFYQKEPQLEQLVQEKKPNFGDMIAKFDEASKRMHRETKATL